MKNNFKNNKDIINETNEVKRICHKRNKTNTNLKEFYTPTKGITNFNNLYQLWFISK